MTSTPTSVQDNTTPKRTNKMASNQPVNLNHLLNFSLPPRETRAASSIPRRSRKTGAMQGVWNKERKCQPGSSQYLQANRQHTGFINAQYRFVMNPNGDYTVHFADSDIFFQWDDILQVIVPRCSPFASAAGDGTQGEGTTACPICLSPPTAPRMTKCGHIYCFPCILHYLSTSENKWARCPICFDSVNARQLKCVKWYDGPPVSEGDDSFGRISLSSATAPRPGSRIRMRLIQRPQITTLALPRSPTWPSDLLPPHQAPFHFLPDVFNFSKFMLATPEYLMEELISDQDQLAEERRLFAGMKDDLGLYFVNAADEHVKHQIAKAEALEETPFLKAQIQKTRRDQKDILDRAAFHAQKARAEEALRSGNEVSGDQQAPNEFLAMRSTATPAFTNGPSRGAMEPPPASQGRSNPRQRRNVNPPPPSTSTYYYYQAASGLPIFLHPLDIRILVSHFNDYPSFPDTITVHVEGTSESTVNEDLRKRCKYLAHLPEGADVIFIETNLEGVVGPEGLKSFEAQLKMRTTKRCEKGRKEDRAKVRAEEREKENERMALARFTHTPVHPRSDLSIADFASLSVSPSRSDDAAMGDQNHLPSGSPPVTSGVWGARSFASALHSPPSRTGSGQQHRRNAQEEWEAEQMWHDLEQQTIVSGGRKKKGSRMVVLGGGGGGRRR